jgi:hypothetical protein
MTECLHEENIEHLVDCPLIRRGFWAKIETLMRTLQMETGCRLFWLFGLKPGLNKWRAADAEEVAMINWAWRALYAEVTRAHIDDKPLDINAAYARFVRLAHLRVQAYGYKWLVVPLVLAATISGITQSSALEAQTEKANRVRTRCRVPDRTDAKS